MRLTLKALSLLLSYPTQEICDEARRLGDVLASAPGLKLQTRQALRRLTNRMAGDQLIDVQGDYVDLFDRTRSLSLHLFEQVHGESRERGQAMIDLREAYAKKGLSLTPAELPDYLPAFLEFASLLPEVEARALLEEPAHVLKALHERLVKRGSDYAAVFMALLELARTRPSAEALDALRRQPDDSADDFAAVDAAWEEAPVRFGPEAPSPTGLAARLRAWRRPAGQSGPAG